MGDFADSRRWKLVNNFTIHTEENLKDRPLMLTAVPKRLDVDVTSFEVIHFIEWPDSYGQEERPDSYADSSFIKFSGAFHDRLIVFAMERGELRSFGALTDATIRPIAAGQIGGKHKATVSDGFSFSGMSSQEVPAEGLMQGEPGRLTYLAEFEERSGSGDKTPPSLTANLFLDEDKFAGLLTTLSFSQRPVTALRLGIIAELFESEVSASLSEPWMSHDYGLLMKGTALASTRARIETVSLSTGETNLQRPTR
jgi:hypothetical protein